MSLDYKLSKKNNDFFLKVLMNKNKKNILKGRFDLEYIKLKDKPDFLINFLYTFKSIGKITIKILYWEKDDIIHNFFINNNKDFIFSKSYKNKKIAGVVFTEVKKNDMLFLKLLLENHFNFENCKKPSLNLRVQICLKSKQFITILDIYDDRGFDIYYLNPTLVDL